MCIRDRIYGSSRGLDLSQQEPNRLRLMESDGSERIIYRAAGAASERAQAHTRLPGGHPEGLIEAFANIYRNVASSVSGDGMPRTFADDFPTVQDGAHGVYFIHKALESSRLGAWVDASYKPPGG